MKYQAKDITADKTTDLMVHQVAVEPVQLVQIQEEPGMVELGVPELLVRSLVPQLPTRSVDREQMLMETQTVVNLRVVRPTPATVASAEQHCLAILALAAQE
jgi:hypothetical protein